MRILSVGNLYPPHDLGGGYEVTWRSSTADLRERGHAVRILTSDFRAPDPQGHEEPDVHRELRLYWRDHDFPRLGWRERIALERHNASVLDRHLSEYRPDVVCWWQVGGTSVALVERVARHGIPAAGVVGDLWMVWAPRADRWLRPFQGRPRLARAAERVTGLPARVDFSGAALWLFNSEYTRRRTIASTGPLERTAVAHPGIDTRLFQHAPPAEWRWRLLYLGRLDERKGVHVALDALRHLPHEAVLTLQGSGDADYMKELTARTSAAGLDGRVVFQSAPRERLNEVYAECDAVVFPVQWEEPWGLVPLEAMAVGRPVIASGTGGSAEYLRDGRNCLIYSPTESPRALAAAVSRLAEDVELRERLTAEGARTAAPFTEAAYNDAIAATLERTADSAAVKQ